MSDSDLDADAELLRRLLNADALCYWRADPQGFAVPVGCAPAGWLQTGFLMPGCSQALRLDQGDAALAALPFILRATLDERPAAALNARCGDSGGFFALWHRQAAMPEQVEGIAELARSAYAGRLTQANTADFALESHLQMQSLVAALPQGVVIVPRRSRHGFVNAAAATWLGVAEGVVENGVLSQALTGFAAKALNEAEVQAYITPFIAGHGRPVLQGCVWRFAGAPVALRVTVAPIGDTSPDGWVWLLDDISDEELAKDLLGEREEKFRRFYQSLQDAVVFSDPDGRLLEWNDAFRNLLGHPDAQLAQMNIAELNHGVRFDKRSAAISGEIAATGYSGHHEKELLLANGKSVVVEARRFVHHDPSGRVTSTWEVMRDIGERKHAEAQLLLAAQVFDRSTDGVILTDTQLSILTCNDAFLHMTGYTRDDVLGMTPRMFKSGRHEAGFYEAMWTQLNTDGWWHGRIWNRRKNGDLYMKWLSISVIRDDSQTTTHYIGMYRDAGIVSQSLQRIEYLATHDELTGLANRTLFDDRVGQALKRATRLHRPLALLHVDLDEFKSINEAFGHKVGDALLVEVAARLSRAVRIEDTVAHVGGDEFLVLADVADVEAAVGVCQKILSSLAEAHQIDDFDATVSASVGVSLFPADGQEADTLLRKAGTALHRAKRQGKNTIRFFTDDMAEQARQQLNIESGLRQALARGELFLMYQPQLRLDDQSLVGCEALLRWRKGGETASPEVFIPIAEKSDLIIEITEWVLTEVCRQIKAWDDAGVAVSCVSVNMSARHFMKADLVERLITRVAQAGGAPQRLCLEITEGALMDAVYSERLLVQLHAAGFHMSLDDFGTGYSSLAYLKRFPIDELKIDRVFVSGIESDESDRAIVAATLSMAHSLGLRVVAEGAETREQIRFLQDRGCELVQGHYFSHPLLPADLASYARDRI